MVQKLWFCCKLWRNKQTEHWYLFCDDSSIHASIHLSVQVSSLHKGDTSEPMEQIFYSIDQLCHLSGDYSYFKHNSMKEKTAL